MKTLQEKNKELAIQHWKYIEGLLDVSLLAEEKYDMDTVIAMVRYHYLTAWEHGAKHYAELLDGRRSYATKNDIVLSQDHIDQLLNETDNKSNQTFSQDEIEKQLYLQAKMFTGGEGII
jgi:hypothetical protein